MIKIHTVLRKERLLCWENTAHAQNWLDLLFFFSFFLFRQQTVNLTIVVIVIINAFLIRRIPLCFMYGAQSAVHETFQQYIPPYV